jgi:histidyl-tRNA synthetase
VLEQLERLSVGSPQAQEGTAKLAELLAAVTAAGVRPERVRIAPAIARGLDYYTGMIYETTLDRLPTIGSICSGGRYDNLAKLYTNQELPGVGASLGLDRLLAGLEELGMIAKVATPAPVFLAYFDRSRLHDYLRLAAQVRAAGIGVEFFCEPKKLGSQLKYADERGFRLALVLGEDEFAAGQCQLKDLATGIKTLVPINDGPELLIAEIRKHLGTEEVGRGQPR